MKKIVLSIRVDDANPLHHLWNNHGIWWIHYTLLEDGVRQQRVRRSLQTRDVEEARGIRDRLFERLAARSLESTWDRAGAREVAA